MPNPKLSQKNLLIAFDAFGTLFTPRGPIGALYGEIARKHGICGDVSDEDIMSSFKKVVCLWLVAWLIITQTFTPFLSTQKSSSPGSAPPNPPSLPHRLVPDLITRFASRDGYTLYNDVIPLFASLRAARGGSGSSRRKIVTAVLTNSDDRVAGILRSFGLRVGHVDPETVEKIAASTYPNGSGSTSATTLLQPERLGENDIDFVLTSYDCGYEKPHRAIFDAARRLALARYAQVGEGEETGREIDDDGEWEAVYVGDEVDKDVVGAEEAGWANAFLVDREGLVRDARDVVRREDVGGEGQQQVRVLRDLRELETYVLG
ncbi:Haloacid dehalogenase [Lasiodiplodia theobromae]|uniref:Haloacid dehalogenase n=1 Tax=Lasiodiplodia theobromae TaxID=45133 RepID=UPI0015C3E0DA|nr:Haloacid dehalogenase [Lasiodiplodia theobromae]KAF4546616.1 Haloacid dehalogenase [Lasiodiplodia theobromae]